MWLYYHESTYYFPNGMVGLIVLVKSKVPKDFDEKLGLWQS